LAALDGPDETWTSSAKTIGSLRVPSNHGLGSNDGERAASLGKQLADATRNGLVDGKK